MNGFLPLLVSLSLIAAALAESPSEPSPGEAKEGIDFISMFNGENLEGWEGKPGAWIVRDGEIWCTGESKEKNWLIWRSQEPGNFTLRLEFLWEKGNSGVQVRSDDLGDWQVFGYQVEVARREVMGLWHHSLLPKDHPKREARHLMSTAGESAMIDPEGKRTNKVKQDAEDVQARYEEGQWNSMEIVAKGDTLTQSINGVLFAELTDRDEELSRKKGWIALQDHGKGCRVAFRNLRIQIED